MARKRGATRNLIAAELRTSTAYKQLADDPKRADGVDDEVAAVADWAMENCARPAPAANATAAAERWEPIPYMNRLCHDLNIETDTAGRPHIYLKEHGYYDHRQAAAAIRRRLRRMTANPPAGLPPVPDRNHRAAYEHEVLDLMTAITPKIQTEPGDLLAVGNGTLDLTDPANPALGDHSPGNYLTGGITTPYNKTAPAEDTIWERLLQHTIPNEQDQRLLAQICGAALSARPAPKNGGLLIGDKNTGKSTLLRIITALFWPQRGRNNPPSVSGPVRHRRTIRGPHKHRTRFANPPRSPTPPNSKKQPAATTY